MSMKSMYLARLSTSGSSVNRPRTSHDQNFKKNWRVRPCTSRFPDVFAACYAGSTIAEDIVQILSSEDPVGPLLKLLGGGRVHDLPRVKQMLREAP